ncbi:MAG TPA: HipA domain-containing protein [Acidimicrobiales bacterium]|nr:HipA domain-containing protein [Acidimicrobiales bacterium]
MAKLEPLPVWLNDVHVADLIAANPWTLRCRYTREALDLAPTGAPLLSCSLPLGTGRLDATVFCNGLLPEGQHREAMASLARVASMDTYHLLARFGRDVAGALVIGNAPEQGLGWIEPYTAATLAAEIAELPQRPLGLHDDSELSVAGIQSKLLLVRLENGAWGRPVHGQPSTHILKLDDPRHPGLVDAEASCLRIAHAIGLTTIDPQLDTIGDQRCLIVERFDRVTLDGIVKRIHQEDVCQALARDPEAARGRGKYQKHGGPSLSEIADLLETWGDEPLTELYQLLRVATFNVAIGNADAHGKNLALLHPDYRTVTLAPLYDTIPTVLWPKLRPTAAMTIGAKEKINTIKMKDLLVEARRWRLPDDQAEQVVAETLDQIRAVVPEIDVLPEIRELVVERIDQITETSASASS